MYVKYVGRVVGGVYVSDVCSQRLCVLMHNHKQEKTNKSFHHSCSCILRTSDIIKFNQTETTVYSTTIQ